MNTVSQDMNQTFIYDSACDDITVVLHHMGATIGAGDSLRVDFRHCRPSDFLISSDERRLKIENVASPWDRFNPSRWWQFPSLDITVPALMVLRSLRLDVDHSGLSAHDLQADKVSVQIGAGSCKFDRVAGKHSVIHIGAGSMRWNGMPGDMSLDCENGSAAIHGVPSGFGYQANLSNGSMRLNGRHIYGRATASSESGMPYYLINCHNGTITITQ